MNSAVVIVGVVLLVLGVGVAAVAQIEQAPAQAALYTDCFSPGMDVARCAQDASIISTWSMVFWLGVVLAIVAVVLIVLGAVWESITERPSAVPPVIQQPVCPMCGRPIQFVPQYNRWFCPMENRYL